MSKSNNKDEESQPPEAPPEAPAAVNNQQGAASPSPPPLWGAVGGKALAIAAVALILVVVVVVTLSLTLTDRSSSNNEATVRETVPRQTATLEIELEGVTLEAYNNNTDDSRAAFESACVAFFSDALKDKLRDVSCKVVLDDRRELVVTDLFTYVIVRFAVSGIGDNPMENFENLLSNIIARGGPGFVRQLVQATRLFQELERIYVVDDEEETPQDGPTAVLTSRAEGVRQVIGERVNSVRLTVSDGPYRNALDWILETDPRQLEAEAPNLFQRYAMAYLYYATGPWSNCGPPPADNATATNCTIYNQWAGSDLPPYTKALYATKDTYTRWLSSEPECNWLGVTCNDNGQIVKIQVDGLGLQGQFPFSIDFLDHLEELTLRTGSLTGPLPGESLAKLTNLVMLDLEEQSLAMSVAEAWEACRTIERVNLDSANLVGPLEIPDSESAIQSFSVRWNALGGPLSPTLGRATNLKVLNLGGNDMKGAIPNELYTLSGLEELHLDMNAFTGSISSSLVDMSSLRVLDLQRELEDYSFWDSLTFPALPLNLNSSEYLSGCLPPVFPVGLEVLNLKGNTLNGTLPGFPTSLHTVQLNVNQFTGSIPESLYELRNLTHLNIADNFLTGTLSPKIGQLTELYFLRLSRNQLTGTIPSTTDQLVALRSADFAQNNLTGVLSIPECLGELGADCYPDIAADNYTEVVCPCCTWCCNPVADQCVGAVIDTDRGYSCSIDEFGGVSCIGG